MRDFVLCFLLLHLVIFLVLSPWTFTTVILSLIGTASGLLDSIQEAHAVHGFGLKLVKSLSMRPIVPQ